MEDNYYGADKDYMYWNDESGEYDKVEKEDETFTEIDYDDFDADDDKFSEIEDYDDEDFDEFLEDFLDE